MSKLSPKRIISETLDLYPADKVEDMLIKQRKEAKESLRVFNSVRHDMFGSRRSGKWESSRKDKEMLLRIICTAIDAWKDQKKFFIA